MDDVRIRAQAVMWKNGIDLYILGRTSHAKEIVMEEHEECVALNPTIEISDQMAQTLMDDLWQCGIRPAEGSGSAGSLAATERHLKDMQKLVFD